MRIIILQKLIYTRTSAGGAAQVQHGSDFNLRLVISVVCERAVVPTLSLSRRRVDCYKREA